VRLGHRRIRRGYTLAELLITLTMLSVIGTVVAQIMMGQQRYYQRTVEQMGVRRELRSALSVLPAELRGLSSVGGDVVDFTTSSITFRSPLGTSLVCAKTGTSTIDVPPLNTARTSTTSWYQAPVAGDTVFALRYDSSGVKGEFWTAHSITSVSSSTSYCAASPYIDAALDAGKARFRFAVAPALPDSVVVSSAIRFARTAKYSLTQGASGLWYLSRSEYLGGAWTAAVPFSGPFMAPAVSGLSGMSLTFYDSTGALVSAVANAKKISRVDVALRAQGLNSSGLYGSNTKTVIDSVALSVALRNRR
jgi:prepilin-type N-terminal cleavage/methylation domain-containing protein